MTSRGILCGKHSFASDLLQSPAEPLWFWQEEAMQLAEAVVAKTDHTLWFKRNKWPQHLAESNLSI